MLEHERWLARAQEDLNAAKLFLKHKSFYGIADHCHQAAEKVLKAYLVFTNQEIVATRDLIELGNLCKKFDQDFQELAATYENLNPYADEFWYHTILDIPEQAETELAIKHAESIMRLVLKKISEPIIGQNEIR